MSLTSSSMLPLGTIAPDFSLPSTADTIVSLSDFADKPLLLVAFICNHCPFVIHIREQLVKIAADYQSAGLAMVAISSNDAGAYPADGPEQMKAEALSAAYNFAYLYDESQRVARAYDAACTPDFFLFDVGRRLVYRGQLDASRPGNAVPVSGVDLRAAIDAVLRNEAVSAAQAPSMGCNIKWKPGNEPA